MSDLARVKANIASMINQGAPESDIDAYVAAEGIALDQLQGSASPVAAAPSQSPSPTQAPAQAPSKAQTYEPLQRFITSRYPHAKFTSDYRTPEHNREVGGVPNSYHTKGQAVDLTGLSKAEQNRLYTDLKNAGVNPTEFKFHDAGSGLHLHIAADHLPEGFGGPLPLPKDWNAQVSERLARGDSLEDMNKWAIQYGRNINAKDYAAFQKSGAKAANVVDTGKPAAPERTWAETGIEAAKSLGQGVVDSVGGLADLAPEAATLAVSGGNRGLVDLVSQLVPDVAGPTLTGAYQDATGGPAEATTPGEEVVNSVSRNVGRFAVPMGAVSRANVARAALSTVLGGTTAGVAGEAAHDVAQDTGLVDPEKARIAGELVGGAAGGIAPNVGKIADARFVSKQSNKNPYASYDAEIAEELKSLTTSKAKSPTDPKGRAVVTVTEINDLERSYTTAYRTKINALDIPEPDKRLLTDALLEDHSIPVEKLEALRGTPAGDAVATGIIKAQRLRALTPEVKRAGGMVTVRRVAEILGTTIGALKGGPIGAPAGLGLVRLAMRRGTEAEAARVHSAERVIKRAPLYEKIGERVGPSGQREAKEALNKTYDDTVSAQQAEKDSASQAREADKAARAERQAQTAAERDRKAQQRAAKGGMTDEQYFKATVKAPRDADPRDLVKQPSAAKAKSALAKLEASSAKAADKFDAELNKPPVAPKEPKPKARPALDIAVENNIKQGIHGNYNAYADSLGVTRSDVLAALRQIKTDDIDPFEIQKLVHGYKLSSAGRAALIPRLQKKLADSGVTEFRAKEAAKAEAKPTKASEKPLQTSDNAKAAEPLTTNIEASADAPADPEIRRVVRPADYDRGTAAFQRKHDRRVRELLDDPDLPNGRRDEIAEAGQIVRDEHKTVESAHKWIDFELVPRLESEGVDPRIIDLIQSKLKQAAEEGKPHRTQEALDAAKRGRPRGRPRKPEREFRDDDVPF